MSSPSSPAAVGVRTEGHEGARAEKPAAVLTEGSARQGAQPGNSVQALVPVVRAVETPESFSPLVMRLPVEVDVAVPVRDFRVRHLLALAPGEVIESQWTNGSDLPLAAGDVRLAWTEFEVVETKLAVRVTRVA